MNTNSKIFLVALLIYIISAVHNTGFFYFDEHYQIIEFAELKTGKNASSDLSWEFGQKMRAAIQPAVAYIFLTTIRTITVNDPYVQTMWLRILNGLFALCCIWYFVKNTMQFVRPHWLSFLIIKHMKNAVAIFTILIIFGAQNPLFAQNKKLSPQTADTVYYFADTASVPKKDRLLRIKDAYLEKFFRIYCSCMTNEFGDIFFTGPERRKVVIDQNKFKSLKTISLAELISLTKANDTIDFRKRYKVFFIIPVNKEKYEMYPIFNGSSTIIQRMH